MKRPTFTQADLIAFDKKWARFVCIDCQAVSEKLGEEPYLYTWDLINRDHWQALVDGGRHEVENWVPRCIPHHQMKSAFEHKRNSKGKRLAAARAIHESALKGEYVRPPGKVRGRSNWPPKGSQKIQSREWRK